MSPLAAWRSARSRAAPAPPNASQPRPRAAPRPDRTTPSDVELVVRNVLHCHERHVVAGADVRDRGGLHVLAERAMLGVQHVDAVVAGSNVGRADRPTCAGGRCSISGGRLSPRGQGSGVHPSAAATAARAGRDRCSTRSAPPPPRRTGIPPRKILAAGAGCAPRHG